MHAAAPGVTLPLGRYYPLATSGITTLPGLPPVAGIGAMSASSLVPTPFAQFKTAAPFRAPAPPTPAPAAAAAKDSEDDRQIGLGYAPGTIKPFVCRGCSRRWKAREGFVTHMPGCPCPYPAKVAAAAARGKARWAAAAALRARSPPVVKSTRRGRNRPGENKENVPPKHETATATATVTPTRNEAADPAATAEPVTQVQDSTAEDATSPVAAPPAPRKAATTSPPHIAPSQLTSLTRPMDPRLRMRRRPALEPSTDVDMTDNDDENEIDETDSGATSTPNVAKRRRTETWSPSTPHATLASPASILALGEYLATPATTPCPVGVRRAGTDAWMGSPLASPRDDAPPSPDLWQWTAAAAGRVVGTGSSLWAAAGIEDPVPLPPPMSEDLLLPTPMSDTMSLPPSISDAMSLMSEDTPRVDAGAADWDETFEGKFGDGW
ncbi:hypothetical protein GGF31_003083 [Allomyces arbusculus]|nr:hypothetical protein GGF31_003083 [Allomyces arbusculus]